MLSPRMRLKQPPGPTRVINSTAPIRVCDNGGWTDTWFARYGCVFNIAVRPHVEVQIEVFRRTNAEPQVIINAENLADSNTGEMQGEPLIEAAIARTGIPEGLAVRVSVFSEAPVGASTGTSASVTVALLGALDLLTPGRMSPHEIAYLAHSVETEALGRQSGIQDQLCAAYGGVNYIEIDNYPHARVSRVAASDEVLWELERRLSLIYLGKSHSSSDVHEKVIKCLADSGPDCKQLEDLRRTAEASRDALLAGDFTALGRAMVENTEAQGRLHPEIIGRDAARVIEIVRRHDARGWKVNGAGGEGGSVTVLGGTSSSRTRAMIEEIEASDGLYRRVHVSLSPDGLRVWERTLDVDSSSGMEYADGGRPRVAPATACGDGRGGQRRGVVFRKGPQGC
jgi:D-glycero-alpha-D-manno-heptose-7-phosphate kinase